MTRPQAEPLARDNLNQQGFKTFLPQTLETSSKGITRIVPLFPRYMFIRFDVDEDQWRSAAYTRGVVRIFGSSPETPTPVRDEVVDRIQTEVDEYVRRALARGAGISPGDRVRVTSGPLKDLVGICERTKRDRVRILSDLLGRVEVDRGSVEMSRS